VRLSGKKKVLIAREYVVLILAVTVEHRPVLARFSCSADVPGFAADIGRTKPMAVNVLSRERR